MEASTTITNLVNLLFSRKRGYHTHRCNIVEGEVRIFGKIIIIDSVFLFEKQQAIFSLELQFLMPNFGSLKQYIDDELVKQYKC